MTLLIVEPENRRSVDDVHGAGWTSAALLECDEHSVAYFGDPFGGAFPNARRAELVQHLQVLLPIDHLLERADTLEPVRLDEAFELAPRRDFETRNLKTITSCSWAWL